MTDEQKSESLEEQNAPRRRPSSSPKPENLDVDDIPVPADEETSAPKTHKVVRVVEVNHQSQPVQEKQVEKKKSGFLGDFLSGAAAGAKEIKKNISVGLNAVTKKDEAPEKETRVNSEPEVNTAAIAAAKAAAEKERKAKFMAEKTAAEKEAEARRIAEHDAAFMPDIDIGDSSVAPVAKKAAPAAEKPAERPAPKAEPVAAAPAVKRTVKAPETTAAPAERPARETRPHKASASSEGGSLLESFKKLPVGVVLGGAAAILVVLVLIIVLATSCGTNTDPSQNTSTGGGNSVVINPEEQTPEGPKELEIKTALPGIADAFNLNNDVVGWLYVPGLEDVDAAVCQDTTSYSYNKRDVTGKYVKSTYWIDGAYYTHKRNNFGSEISDLSKNTVVFGHSDLGTTNLNLSDDDPTGPLFSQLFNFKDPSFAEKTPYIFFSTADDDYVWEVFSVFYNDKTVDGDLWYIEPSPGKAAYQTLLDTAQNRSLYNYDVEVSTSDHILTLSTCTVGFGYSTRENYRFVIMAKLVENPEGLLEKNASFVINSDAPVPSTFKTEFAGYAASWKPSASATDNSSSATSTGSSSPASSVSSSASSSK